MPDCVDGTAHHWIITTGYDAAYVHHVYQDCLKCGAHKSNAGTLHERAKWSISLANSTPYKKPAKGADEPDRASTPASRRGRPPGQKSKTRIRGNHDSDSGAVSGT